MTCGRGDSLDRFCGEVLRERERAGGGRGDSLRLSLGEGSDSDSDSDSKSVKGSSGWCSSWSGAMQTP